MKIKITLILALCMHIALCQPTVTLVPFASGFPNGISDIASAGDNRLFIVEQLGYISIVDSAGNVLPNYFLNIHSKVTPNTFSPGNEQGLLGLAFSPTYQTDGYFYVNYTNKTGVGNTTISRFQVSSNPDSAIVGSEEVLLNIHQPYSNHNGGSMKFGYDGFLYIGMGDGGSGGDPDNRAQNTDSLLGKILRIDVSVAPGYTNPTSNPFFGGGGAPEIWAMGLRNPWKISFDRDNYNLWIADVGQSLWEEVNFQPFASVGGENYGWRCYEGNHPFNTTGCMPFINYAAPVHEYSHMATSGCSVTGGFVYRGTAHPALTGYYFFSDYCNGKIYALSPAFTSNTAGTFTGNLFTSFGENNNGELFIGSQSNGVVYKIGATGTGLENYNSDVNGIVVYPNPNYGEFVCEVDANINAKCEIEITDVTGKLCYHVNKSLTTGHNNISIDMKGIAAGTYLMKLTTVNGTSYKKFDVIK